MFGKMEMLRRPSFKNKVLFSTLLIVLLLGIAVAIVVRWVLLPSLTSELKARGVGIAQSIAGLSRGYILTEDRPMLVSLIFDEKQLEERRLFVSYILVLDRNQKVLAHTFVGEFPSSIVGANKVLPDQIRSIKPVKIPEGHVYDIAVPVKEGIYQIGTIRVGLDKAFIDRLISKLAVILLGAISVIIVIGFLVSQWLSKYITRPLTQVTQSAYEISRGNLDVSFDFGKKDKCWEILKCDKTDCPAYGKTDVPCWYIEETLCTGAPMGDFPQKLDQCGNCKVYTMHRGDEIAQLADAFSHMTKDLKVCGAELKRIYDFQTNLIESSIDGIVATDNTGNIVLFNEGAEKVFGYKSEDVIGKMDVADLYPPGQAENVKKDLRADAYGGAGKLANYETSILNKAGNEVPVWLSASVIYEDGKVLGTVVFLRDITERKRLEKQVLQSERLATIGQAAAYISHEIKNPLMLIGGFARQVLRDTSQERKNKKKLEIITNEVKRLEEFLSGITEFTKISKPKKTVASINTVVLEVSALFEQELEAHQVAFDKSMDPRIPETLFDPEQIKQVLINIVKNAVEAMPEGGKLYIETHLKTDTIEMCIRDTGKGIAPKDLESIFRPFVTTKSRGTGLGLAISREIIQVHEGDVCIESKLGTGTVCIVTLPVNKESIK
ncbi:MAG: PAS domain S-box protein [Desulfobacterales bacterium]|nr:PAS domain S-box protein [Desulfobacterales bacterium]